MTIRHLEIFTAAADEGSMTLAAKKLHISQPTVSQAVSELEKYYGVRLFERLSQKIYLTREGELMLSFSRHILDSFEKMEQAVGSASKRTSLTIGCSVSVGTCMINDILDAAYQRMPECEISVVVANSSDIEQAILRSKVDLGIVEGMIQSSEILTTPICEDELVIVCGRGHELAGRKYITLDMLDGQPYISRESGSAERNQIERLFEDHNVRLNRIFCSTNTKAMENAVIRGRGIAVFSRRVVEEECGKGDIIVLPVEGTPIRRHINLALHKNKYLSESIRIICDILGISQ